MSIAELKKLESQIAKDRKRLHIVPVAHHSCPPWAQKRLDAVLDRRSIHCLDSLPGPRIVDHWGESPSGSLVCEPYATVSEVADKVQAIAAALGVRYTISPTLTSWWLPGKTIRIEFYESEDSRPLDELRTEAKALKKIGKTLLGVNVDRLPMTNYPL